MQKNANDKEKAFSYNIEFSHERMGHGKEMLSNSESPKIYFNKNFTKK